MNKKEQQAQRAKQEDVVLNKVLWWIVGAVVLEVLLLLLNKVYANYTVEQIELAKSLRDVFSVLMIALPICFVVLLIWAVVARKSGKFTRLSSVLAGVMLALAVCAVVIRVFDESGIRLLYVAVPAVAVLALLMAACNGYQGALMAPTEVLARQHFESITQLFETYHIEKTPVLVTGSMTAKEKRLAYERIQRHEADIVIGTHALIQQRVHYDKLALVLSTEQ